MATVSDGGEGVSSRAGSGALALALPPIMPSFPGCLDLAGDWGREAFSSGDLCGSGEVWSAGGAGCFFLPPILPKPPFGFRGASFACGGDGGGGGEGEGEGEGSGSGSFLGFPPILPNPPFGLFGASFACEGAGGGEGGGGEGEEEGLGSVSFLSFPPILPNPLFGFVSASRGRGSGAAGSGDFETVTGLRRTDAGAGSSSVSDAVASSSSVGKAGGVGLLSLAFRGDLAFLDFSLGGVSCR
jgi:hypothetical protein